MSTKRHKPNPFRRMAGRDSHTCGWCGAELADRGDNGPERFFCAACQANNAPCCQCGERDCYLLPSNECPECAYDRAEQLEDERERGITNA